jgi:hypothetical protein
VKLINSRISQVPLNNKKLDKQFDQSWATFWTAIVLGVDQYFFAKDYWLLWGLLVAAQTINMIYYAAKDDN